MSQPSPRARSAREAFGRPFGGLAGPSDPLRPELSRRQRRRLPAKLIVGIVSALLLVSTALDVGPAVRAGLHDGTHGMWVATAKTCHGSACVWIGKFVGPGGHVVVSGAHYAGALPAGIRAGTTVPAIFTGSGLVFPTAGSDLWIELVIALVLSVLGLYWAGHAWVSERLSRQRRTEVRAPGGRG